MTPLRQRMLDAMTVRGLAERTKDCYVEAVARLARHYHRSPDLLNTAEVEAYLLHLVKDRKLSYSSVNQVASGSRFLFETVLGRASDIAHLRPPMAKVPQKQPELLARQEIARLFACCSHPVYRTTLQTIYATGLRISEACSLRVDDIDSAPDRMCVRVNAGKGGADRYSILTPLCWHCCASTVEAMPLSAIKVDGCLPTPMALLVSTSKPCNAPTKRPATAPVSLSLAAPTPCAIALPPTCWRAASTCTPSAVCSVTATSAPPAATCI